MRTYSIFLSASILLVSCAQSPTEKAVVFDYFGDSSLIASEALTSAQVLEALESNDSVWVTFEAPIQAVCQTKGCWMEVSLDSNVTGLVRFKDYAFFVPMDASGELARIAGSVQKKELSVEWLQEQARDANEPDSVIAAITKPEVRLTIMASGVALAQKEAATAEVKESEAK